MEKGKEKPRDDEDGDDEEKERERENRADEEREKIGTEKDGECSFDLAAARDPTHARFSGPPSRPLRPLRKMWIRMNALTHHAI